MLFAAMMACGPEAPGNTTGEGGTTATATATATSGPATDGSSTRSSVTMDAPTTDAPPTGEPLTTTDTATSTTTEPATTGEHSSSSGINDTGVCMVDPAAGLCSDSCRQWTDCCQCDGKLVTPTGATECTIAMGIVTAVCPWSVWDVFMDGEPQNHHDACDGAKDGWAQHVDSDVTVELCGDTCTAYLQGSFAELKLDMFCEAA